MSTQYGVSPLQLLPTTSPMQPSGPVVALVSVVSVESLPDMVVGSLVTGSVVTVGSLVLVEPVGVVVVVGPVVLGSEVVSALPLELDPSRTRHIWSWIVAGATQPLLSTAHALHTRSPAQGVIAYAQWSLLITTQPASAPSEPAAANASTGRSFIEVQ
jgi:hypothetical protein